MSQDKKIPVPQRLRLQDIFSNNMIVQQNTPVAIWGTGVPGSTVMISFKGNSATVSVDDSGNWLALLPPHKADTVPAQMTVSDGRDLISIENILVGEVWLCIGQSNMSMGIMASADGIAEVSNADFPDIRLHAVNIHNSPAPQAALNGRWLECSPANILKLGELHHKKENWRGFSAIAYHFGKIIHQELEVPVGLVQAAVGGSNITSWLPDGIYGKNALVPIVPFGFKGILWYQGEADNFTRPAWYIGKTAELVSGWREMWGRQDMPWYIVQLAPLTSGDGSDCTEVYPEIWEAQQRTVECIPHMGIAGTGDVGEPEDVHPVNKKNTGRRLALQAMRKTYGRDDIIADGPMFKSLSVNSGHMIVSFENTGDGLRTRDGKEPDCFELMDAKSGGFIPACTRIENDSVILSSENITAPVAVRFGWSNDANPNLINSAGLPAYPFRSGTGRLWQMFQIVNGKFPQKEQIQNDREKVC